MLVEDVPCDKTIAPILHESHRFTAKLPNLTFLALVGTKPLKLHGDVDFYVMPQFPSHLLTPGCPRGDNSTHPHQGLLVPPAPPCLPDLLPAGANCSFLIFISVINNLDRTQNNFFLRPMKCIAGNFLAVFQG